MESLFYIAALVGVVSTGMVITRLNAVHALLYLIVSLLAVALIFLLLGAPFVAALEVIIYAGAIMVLFLFVIMLLNLQRDVDDGLHHAARRLFGWLLGVVLAAQGWLLLRRPWDLGPKGDQPPEVVAQVGNTQAVGVRLFTDYLLPFEVTSLVLLVAIVGAVVLSLRRGKGEGVEEAP